MFLEISKPTKGEPQQALLRINGIYIKEDKTKQDDKRAIQVTFQTSRMLVIYSVPFTSLGLKDTKDFDKLKRQMIFDFRMLFSKAIRDNASIDFHYFLAKFRDVLKESSTRKGLKIELREMKGKIPVKDWEPFKDSYWVETTEIKI